MRTHELIDALCFDETNSPYPIEALYTLEGLKYFQLVNLLKLVQRGSSLPPWETLTESEESSVTSEVPPSLPRKRGRPPKNRTAVVATTPKQAEPTSTQPAPTPKRVRRDDFNTVISLTAHLLTGKVVTPALVESAIDTAVAVIEAVDRRVY